MGATRKAIRAGLIGLLVLSGCGSGEGPRRDPAAFEAPPVPDARPPAEPLPAPERILQVTASAYNSTPAQTDDRPFHAAWGDSLVPGMRAIAISRDLIPMGLGQGVKVRIEGMPGEYAVLDKMDRRWRKRIDVYFGTDVAAARRWGERKVVIRWIDTASVNSRTGRALVLRDSLPGIKLGCNQDPLQRSPDC